ncbi:MAG: hypothetical protein CVV41_18230 [Candidatus Riflebacteria bacterium HGW-Riflebacteria-1]|nr:MAG: hypothetical protein CVV41_18230 [Candidatus Riflebacteria bacterium HGW-Riflebacteria-1]
MGFFDFLFGNKEDPTKDWPVTDFSTPDFVMQEQSFGRLHFGCELADAQHFGRPDLFVWRDNDYCELVYACHGFQLDFEEGRLCYIAFFIGPDSCLPNLPGMVFSQPCFEKVAQFTQKTTSQDLVDLFGEPISEDFDSEEIVRNFVHSRLVFECELTPEGFLKRLNLFPEQD